MSGDERNGRRGRSDLPLQVKCPQCGERVPYEGNPWRPFCTERCKMIDLGAWAEERYTIATQDAPGQDEEG